MSVWLAVAALLGAAPPRALAQSAADARLPHARVAGRVVEAETKLGIANVRVWVRGTGRSTHTDAEGRFAIDELPPGPQVLDASLDGYRPAAPFRVVLGAHVETRIDIPYRLGLAEDVRVEMDAPAMPAAVPVIGATTLDGRSLATAPGTLDDVQRAFQSSLGVSGSNDDRNDLLVRGGGAIENAIRLDGFDVPAISHFAAQGGTGGGLGVVPPWLLRQATLEPGGFSVALGERASSALHLSVREGNRERMAGGAGAGVGGLSAHAEGPLAGGRGSWLASVRRSFLELVIERGDARAAPRYTDVLAKFDLALSPRHRLTGLLLAAADDVEAQSSYGYDELRDEQRMGLAGVALETTWSERTSTSLVASFGANTICAEDLDAGVVDDYDRSREAELRLRAEVRRTAGARLSWMAGASLKRAFLRFDLNAGSFRNEFNNIVAPLSENRRAGHTDAASYIEAVYRPGGYVEVTGGARLDRWGSSASASATPRAKLSWQPRPSIRLTGGWGVYRQAIPYIWIGSHPANAALEPVRSSQAILGAEWRPASGVVVTIEGFDKRYRGYPVDPTHPARVLISAAADFESPFVGELTSGGRVTAQGVDSRVVARFRQFHVDAGYSRWRVRQRGLDAVWRPADHDVPAQSHIQAAYTPSRRWSVAALWRHAGGRPYTPFDGKASSRAGARRYDRTRINAERFPAYHRLDLRTDWTLPFRGRRLILYGEVQNVYGRDNVYVYDWDRAARRAEPIYQRGITPVAGLRLEF